MMAEPAWTPLIGFRRASIHVAVRVPFAIVGCAVVLWLAAPVLNWLPGPSIRILPLIILVMIWPGMAIGYGLSRGIADAAGVSAWWVTVIAVAGVAVSVWGGAEIATAFRAIGDWQLGMAKMTVAAGGMVWAVREIVFED